MRTFDQPKDKAGELAEALDKVCMDVDEEVGVGREGRVWHSKAEDLKKVYLKLNQRGLRLRENNLRVKHDDISLTFMIVLFIILFQRKKIGKWRGFWTTTNMEGH